MKLDSCAMSFGHQVPQRGYGRLGKAEVRPARLPSSLYNYRYNNDIKTIEVKCIGIPGYDTEHVVTVIDHCSRHLLPYHVSPSNRGAGAIRAPKLAHAEPARMRGPRSKSPTSLTDASSFLNARGFVDS
jgi:hypothetical protein